MTFRLQDSVRGRLGNNTLTGSEASEEDRILDIRFVVEQVTRFVWFFFLVKDIPVKKFIQDKDFNASFYGTTHKQIVKKLNAENVSVFTIAFFLHVMLSHCRVYSNPNKGEPKVHAVTNKDFNGNRALQETVLWLTVAGQDCNPANYTFVNSNAEFPGGFWAYNESGAECITQVPGIGISQTDKRNQEALKYSYLILRDLRDEEMPVHARDMLLGSGKYKPNLKPSTFIRKPLKWGAWPQPKNNPESRMSVPDSEEDEYDEDGEDSD